MDSDAYPHRAGTYSAPVQGVLGISVLHLRNARHFTGHILRSIGLVVLVVVVLGLLHLEMDTVFDMNAIRNSTQFLSWRHRSNLQECTGLVGPGTPGVKK
jgi:membrane-anchored glycerophosphoryl diester phosphodiesterase (GDPDase)